MIYWFTGQPGHGKTLNAIEKLLEFKAKGRIVYACNVREFDYDNTGVLRMTPEDFRNWTTFLPDGAVALVDDLHLDFRNTGRIRQLLQTILNEVVQEGDHPTVVDGLNTNDLVIISRSVNSGQYEIAEETATWSESITAPMMILSGYVLRANRMGYTTGNNIPDTTSTIRLEGPLSGLVSLSAALYENVTPVREVVDGMSSWWASIHGYRHPVLDAAVRDQLDRVADRRLHMEDGEWSTPA